MIEILECDFENEEHCNAQIELLNHYISDKMGGGIPLSDEQSSKLIEGLKNHPSKLIVLAKNGDEFVGLANCFINFGTFAAKPFINIHDIVVHSSQRGKGVGDLLMDFISQRAIELGCGKITLEVRADNKVAQSLYKKKGYDECEPVMHFWTKRL